MSAPWEEYQSTEKEPGPWNDFASSGTTTKAPNYGDIDPIVGASQGAASILSGAVAAPAAGLTGMGAAIAKALGITDAEPADVVRKVQQALTYQPPSKTGQAIAGAVSAPFEALANVGDTAGQKVTDVTGSPMLGAAANTAIQAIPMIVGKVAGKVGGKLAASEVDAAATRAKAAIDAAPLEEKVKAATDAGFTLTPNAANAGLVSTSTEGLAGSAKLQKAASVKNQPVVNDLVRKDIGLDEKTPATPEALDDLRAEAGKSYDALRDVGELTVDKQYPVTALSPKIESAWQGARSMDPHTVMTMSAADAVDAIKQLRSEAAQYYRAWKRDAQPDTLKKAQARDDAASNLEDLFQRNLTGDSKVTPAKNASSFRDVDTNGDVSLLEDLRDARTKIAKIHQADAALGPDGNFDANVYGKIYKKNPDLMTGPAQQVGQFAATFPKLVQQAQRVGHAGMDFGDLALMAFRAAKGATGDVLALGARPAARAALLSSPVQRAITAPPSYARPMSSRAAQLLSDTQAQPIVGAGEMASGQNAQDRLNYIKSLAR